MGADQFQVRASGETVAFAFVNAVKNAQYEHGHGGYTGTIAEKADFIECNLPTGVRGKQVAEALSQSWNGDLVVLENLLGPDEMRRVFAAYDDKWGPAVAIPDGQDHWIFCGWASS